MGDGDEDRMTTVTTHDLYYSAYLLSRGSRIENIITKSNGHRQVAFEFSNPEMDRLVQEYRTGKAVTNVRQYKSSLDHLKDIIFEGYGHR